MVHTTSLRLIGATLLLTSTTVVLAHGHDNHAGETTDMGPLPSPMSAASMNSSSALPQSYFAYPAMGGLLLGHIVLMTLAWFFVLPIGEPIVLYGNHFSSANHSIFRRNAECCAVSPCSSYSDIFLSVVHPWSVAWDCLQRQNPRPI